MLPYPIMLPYPLQHFPSFSPVLCEGYTRRHQSMIEIRRQIIVVAFDTWHVVAYDADLTLLWKVQLMDVPHDVSQVGLFIQVLIELEVVKKEPFAR